ncbi:unnamed protein product [Candidula unifasciata]|uniref:G-protein coupled receptors family 1 profile domain-containing protein n=1 Tax=Candidula unifasciata TaxID=100452 RepID=A0A8S3ZFS0_9EUPU|nr:unnamed protein product [Candidula unifasciata]
METEGYPWVSTVTMEDVDLLGDLRPKFLIMWAKAIPLVFLAVSTVTFNMVVLWMFKMKKSLRSCKNIYLASLALADLLIGLCMFLAIFQQLKTKGDWLPEFWCRFYLILRQSALYVSLLSLVLITGDRWWSIHYPFSYRSRTRKRYAFIAVGCVWVFGFVVHIPPVTLWNDITIKLSTNTSSVDSIVLELPTTCELPFSQSTIFVSTASVVQYFLPLMAMLSLNCSLYVGILQRKQIQIRRSVSTSERIGWHERRTSVSSIPDFSFFAEESIHLLNGASPRRFHTRMSTLRRNSADVVLLRSAASSPLFGNMNSRLGHKSRRFSWTPRNNSIRPMKCGEELAKSLLVKQDRRAAFWLGLLVIVFLLCWLPHTIVGILQSTKCVNIPQWTKDLTLWFLLINSAVNPLMYGFFNREIRRAFKYWLWGETSPKWRVKNALALYGVGLTTAVAVPKRVSSGFEAVPE